MPLDEKYALDIPDNTLNYQDLEISIRVLTEVEPFQKYNKKN